MSARSSILPFFFVDKKNVNYSLLQETRESHGSFEDHYDWDHLHFWFRFVLIRFVSGFTNIWFLAVQGYLPCMEFIEINNEFTHAPYNTP